ncbi:dirigent protein 21-like [Wolffia australiana]
MDLAANPVASKNILVKFVKGEDQLADALTKPLQQRQFLHQQSKLNVLEWPLCLKGVCVFLFAAAVNGQDSFDLGEEKKTHPHFFFHDLVSGPNATAIPIVRSPTMNSTVGNFGLVAVFDNAPTEGPNRSSKVVDRAQGLYATASQQDLALLMTMNFYFTDGFFRGSSLVVLAKNAVAEETRELSCCEAVAIKP